MAEIEALLGEDVKFYRGLQNQSPATPASASVGAPSRPPPTAAALHTGTARKGRALITASRGIGDILRVTPLVRVARQLGYEVDVLLETDYAEAVELLTGAPEIRRVFHRPSARCHGGNSDLNGLAGEQYDVATFTLWSAALRSQVRAKRTHEFDRAHWLAEGDTRSVERIARALGWEGELPAPLARASDRRFNLPPGTVALHPGCKYEWPWKKWHGFDELARRFASVVVVGSPEDRRTDNTYFRRPFAWPGQAQDFTGQLNLADTAALLRECAALIANDSGLMHLGVALGVPTFGLFGLTSPQREAMPSKNFFPITKGLPCEPACRQGTWGRRDCHRHLECLKSLTPDEVFMKVSEAVPNLAATARAAGSAPPPATTLVPSPPDSARAARETINVAYYGWVFDASGYGHAARGYLHALHQAGVNLTVVDLAGRARQVHDPLVESLVGRKLEADFHLFHGIPPFWARHAFPLRNVVAMTVWETDTMPTQWRPALNHALEVWLPCEFNVAVFAGALQRPVFKLPHTFWPDPSAEPLVKEPSPACGLREDDFVFYSLFEWQDRKGPREMIEAFLRAFPAEQGVVLVLKANPGAAGAAAATLAEVRRRVPSAARVEVRCEAWSETQVAALHARGDCYVSLHRGEGWNLPLFEAACRGKAIVATGFSGPLEYLDPAAHGLVRHQAAPVRQRYAYYLPQMQWAEPDVGHAAELMQRAVSEREPARQRAAAHAQRLRQEFSPERIGGAARQRLSHLLRKTNPAKWDRLQAAERQGRLRPAVPIAGEWYDADYFEHGLKSNWRDGYHWSAFSGLFRETAAFLAETFPEAQSFLDAGCAKGFLVRALLERGKEAWGFDHSRWALEHAEEMAEPHLREASAETLHFDHPHDVLLAFGLLESLTEEQARAFLERARPFTRQALAAVIGTREDERAATAQEDRDLSHVTLRSRAWWHQVLRDAGWRHDALHRTLERACQKQGLPHRMGWQVFLASPG